MLFVLLWIVGQAEDVIRGYLIKPGQLNQYIRGNIPLTKFVVAVDSLGAIQNLSKLPLLQILVFSQIANPLVHTITFN